MASTYRSVVLAARPDSEIIPGKTFNIRTDPVPSEAELKDGEVLLQTRYLSLDPAMRGWLNGELSLLTFGLAGKDLPLLNSESQTRDLTFRPSLWVK